MLRATEYITNYTHKQSYTVYGLRKKKRAEKRRKDGERGEKKIRRLE